MLHKESISVAEFAIDSCIHAPCCSSVSRYRETSISREPGEELGRAGQLAITAVG